MSNRSLLTQINADAIIEEETDDDVAAAFSGRNAQLQLNTEDEITSPVPSASAPTGMTRRRRLFGFRPVLTDDVFFNFKHFYCP
jgi:hypothetical protein